MDSQDAVLALRDVLELELLSEEDLGPTLDGPRGILGSQHRDAQPDPVLRRGRARPLGLTRDRALAGWIRLQGCVGASIGLGDYSGRLVHRSDAYEPAARFLMLGGIGGSIRHDPAELSDCFAPPVQEG